MQPPSRRRRAARSAAAAAAAAAAAPAAAPTWTPSTSGGQQAPLPLPDAFNTCAFSPAYSQRDWARHREHWRHLRHLGSWASSLVFRNVLPMAAVLTAEAALLCWARSQASLAAAHSLALPLAPFSLTSFALAMLLVFRTNQSHARWWEARMLWGGTVNACRSLARETLAGMRRATPRLCDLSLCFTVAYANCLVAHLQGLSDAWLKGELEDKLEPLEVEIVMASQHRPGACLHALSEVIRAAQERGEIDSITHLYLAERLHNLTDTMGACERILKTPMPLSYTRHTSRFLVLWLGLLPLALIPQLGAVTVPAVALISVLLLGIDEIGVNLEEPFRRLPLKDIADSIEASVAGYDEENSAVRRMVLHRAGTAPPAIKFAAQGANNGNGSGNGSDDSAGRSPVILSPPLWRLR